MAEEKKDKLSGQNENDYGFPFVKVTPLKTIKDQDPQKEEVKNEEMVKKNEIEEPATIEKQITSHTISAKKKRSQLPLQFSLVMLILIILAAMAYFLYFLPDPELEGQSTAENMEMMDDVEVEGKQEEDGTDSQLTEELESSEIEEEEAAEIVEETVQAVVQEPEAIPASGGNLFQVRESSSPPQYYIIVSSTSSEAVAMDQVNELKDKKINLWLIYPYGETTNYRLAIGKYPALSDATQALEGLKADFGSSIWILKY
ncbi:SPOR domain-containing protein [Cecembia sp.]|uniref:SPOR domain-containing protein n=1 Tax=Cecembia sp. TaxID=1898110 RepID=UPI0025BB37A2|nr:SPOR domain-containing protein [Cecembia sp.]